MAEARDFSVILFLVLIAISAFFANDGVISGLSFAACILVSAVAVLLLRNIDRLEQLVFRRGDNQILVRMTEIQRNVYAKVEQMQQIAIGVARFSVASIVSESRMVGSDHQDRMLKRRDDLDAFLKDAGIDDTHRREILNPVLLWVDWDLRRDILTNVLSAWKVPPNTAPTDTNGRDALRDEIKRLLSQPDRLAGLAQAEELLKSRGVSSEILTQSINRYRQTLTDGKLPRIGSADNLSNPPW